MVRTRPQSPLTRMVLFTDIISHITTTDSDGKPTTILTTYPSPSDDGKDKTTVTTDKDGVVHTDIISHITTTDSDGKPTTILTTYPSPSDDGKDKTTVTTDKDGVVHTDIISHITTTDSDGKPTTILTTYPSPENGSSAPDAWTTTYTEDGTPVVEVVHKTTYTASNGDVIITTVTELSKEAIDAQPAWVSPTTSTITTTDSDGHSITITTSYLIDNNGNTEPIPNEASSSMSPSDDGKDKTTVTTDKDGVVHTDIISHITTTDSDGKPTTILTTYPSPSDDGKDKTTVTTDKDGVVHTDIIAHHHH
ncbi:Hypothetical protein J6893_02922 [Nakaseomyces glabratus]